MKFKIFILLSSFVLLNSFKAFAIESSTNEIGLPQLNFKTYSEQIFWFLIIFLLLYLFIVKYIVPKIKVIQTSRERLINQNISVSKNNTQEAEKIKNIIYLQLKDAQEFSKNNIKKVTQELLQLEEKKINEVRISNEKLSLAKKEMNQNLNEEFFRNYNTNLSNITSIILHKLNIPISQDIINKVIENTALDKEKKNA